MESDAASTSTNVAKPKSRVKLAVIALAVIAVVVSALFVGMLLSSPMGQDAWLFKGAYAEYEGTAKVMFVTVSFSVRQEVVDFNSTHAELLASLSMSSLVSEPLESETTMWVDLSTNQYVIEEATLVDSYEAKSMYFEGIGNRDCVVYEYATDGPTMTIYVDKQIGWPLKMTVSMIGEDSVSLELDINLVETNIPGLK